jgi:hypothetical protein
MVIVEKSPLRWLWWMVPDDVLVLASTHLNIRIGFRLVIKYVEHIGYQFLPSINTWTLKGFLLAMGRIFGTQPVDRSSDWMHHTSSGFKCHHKKECAPNSTTKNFRVLEGRWLRAIVTGFDSSSWSPKSNSLGVACSTAVSILGGWYNISCYSLLESSGCRTILMLETRLKKNQLLGPEAISWLARIYIIAGRALLLGDHRWRSK